MVITFGSREKWFVKENEYVCWWSDSLNKFALLAIKDVAQYRLQTQEKNEKCEVNLSEGKIGLPALVKRDAESE